MNIFERVTAIFSYLLAFSWGIAIFLSFLGWGTLVNRFLFAKNEVDWGHKAAWGLAFTICVGGILNVTWTISPTTILIYLGIGFIYWLFTIYQIKNILIKKITKNNWLNYKKEKKIYLGILLVVILILFQYAGWVYNHRFHPEDYAAYFVFPKKMLQTGSLGIDSFSGRRLESSLGGQAFLSTLPLSLLNETHFKLIDPGVALIIIVGLIISYLNKKKIPKELGVLIIAIFLLFPHPQTITLTNITTGLTPIALFLSFFMTLDWEKLRADKWISNACIIALITASICSLKSNLIPACGLLFIFSYIFYFLNYKNKKIVIYEFLLASILTLILLLPWMISMYQSSGTLLYPILGKGYHITNYSKLNLLYSELTVAKIINILMSAVTMFYFVTLVVLSILILPNLLFKSSYQNISNPHRQPLLSLVMSAGLGTIVMALTTGGAEIERYTFSYLYAAIFVLIINACQNKTGTTQLSNSVSLAIAMIASGMIIGNDVIRQFEKRNNISKIKIGLSNMPLVSEQEMRQHLKMQQSVPKSETILARLEKPFLLDFKRNHILIIDLPGVASPPPGMPLFKGSEALANYLTSKSIRYIAYGYKNEAGTPKKMVEYRIKNWNINHWVKTASELGLDFQDNLKELGQTRKRIYDDGDIFVIDLLQEKKIMPNDQN